MRFLLIPLLLICTLPGFGQGAGFGYQIDFGHKSNFNVGEGYDQEMQTMTHSLFLRWHSHQGRNGHQIVTGLRFDSIGFKNEVQFYNPRTDQTDFYNTDAYLKRIAWRMGYKTQRQFIGTPGEFVVAFNYGLFYEFTSQMKRKSFYDEYEYKLYGEQNRHNLIGMVGIESRFWFVTLGLKYEHMFFDMINHNNVKNHQLTNGNQSELRGLNLSPSMVMFYIVFSFDFFNEFSE